MAENSQMRTLRYTVLIVCGLTFGAGLTLAMMYRFAHPERTETELLLDCWREYLAMVAAGFLGGALIGPLTSAKR